MTMNKKELAAQYKERKKLGGIFVIRKRDSDKILLEIAQDLPGAQNRFEFSKKVDSCTYLKLSKDWKTFGKDQFEFEVLEELVKKESQTQKEFKEDLEVLKSIWMEKLKDKVFY